MTICNLLLLFKKHNRIITIFFANKWTGYLKVMGLFKDPIILLSFYVL